MIAEISMICGMPVSGIRSINDKINFAPNFAIVSRHEPRPIASRERDPISDSDVAKISRRGHSSPG